MGAGASNTGVISGMPNTATLPAGQMALFKDASAPPGYGVILAYNDGGTICSIFLSPLQSSPMPAGTP